MRQPLPMPEGVSNLAVGEEKASSTKGGPMGAMMLRKQASKDEAGGGGFGGLGSRSGVDRLMAPVAEAPPPMAPAPASPPPPARRADDADGSVAHRGKAKKDAESAGWVVTVGKHFVARAAASRWSRRSGRRSPRAAPPAWWRGPPARGSGSG